MRRTDLTNLLSLTAIQVANSLTPLLVFPYVLTVIGTEAYAKLAMTEAIAIAALSFVLYSFEIDGVARVIKLNWKVERIQVSRVFSSILYVRIIIFAICALFALISRLFLEREISNLLLIWLTVPLSYALQPSWLFQAAEKNSVLAILTVSSRLLSALLVVTLIKGPVDVLLIPAIIGSCNVASATASLFYARQSLGLEFQKIPLLELINFLREGKKIFMGNLSVLLYRDFNVVILGLVQGSATAVAAYSIAEKVTKGLQATMRPFNQIYFPKTLKRLGTNKKVERESLKDIWPCIYPQFIALSLVLSAAILAFFVAAIYFNIEKNVPELTNIAILSTLMIPATFFGIANFMLGTVGLNYLKEQDYMYKSILITGAANTVLCFLLSSQLSAIGTALTFTVSEGFLLALITSKFLTNRHPAKLKNN